MTLSLLFVTSCMHVSTSITPCLLTGNTLISNPSLSVEDDRLGAYYRKTMAIADRLGKSLEFDKVMDALQRIHDGQLDPIVLRAGEFPVYLEIEVGGKSQKQMLGEMKSNDLFVSDWAKDIMSKDAFTTLPEQTSVHLARVKVSDLGFTEQPTTTELWARIRELGHELCPAEVGPHLRLQFADQEKGDYFWVAMEQISDSVGYPYVFYIRRNDDGERWLYTTWVRPDYRWHLDRELVFVLRK